MEEKKFVRTCYMNDEIPCYNHLCEHQCYMDEAECREPEKPPHSKECPVTGARCHNQECHGSKCAFDNLPEQREHFSKRLYRYYEQNNEMLEHFVHIIEAQLKVIDRLTRHHDRKHQRVKQVLFTNFNNNKFITMSVTLASNQSAPIVLGLIDSDTLLPITATFAGESETSDNPAAATTDPILGLVGVAPGSGNLTSVATWTYTDKNTNQLVTKQLTTVTPFTVSAVIAAENVSMTVTLGTPVTQPPATV